jgi:CRP/FNR family cyclic AMP-dependent transcriptional regulator
MALDIEQKSLDNVHLFADLNPAQRLAIVEKCAWQRHQSQGVILDPEVQDTAVYFITRGRIRVVNYGVNGKEVSFAEIGEGQCFGELSAIDNKPRSAGVIALEPTFVASMKADVFLEVVKEHPEVSIALLKKLTALVRDMSGRVMQLSTQNAYARVYAEVLRLTQIKIATLPKLPTLPRLVLSPAPVHTDIAARVSTTRETVARAFGVMTKQKIVKRVKGGIEILDFPALEELVEESKREA